jgi:hypothetical protein
VRVTLLLVTAALFSLGCSQRIQWFEGEPGPAVPFTEFEVAVTEDIARLRFDIRIDSKSAEPLCVAESDWPDRFGRLHFKSHSVYVLSGDRKHPIREYSFGFPLKAHRIEPGDHLDGFISFSEFGPEMSQDPDVGRRLVFNVRPFYCL